MAALNFYGTTSSAGQFGFNPEGLVQGEVQPSPVAKFAVSGASVDASVTGPVYGGMLIEEFLPAVDNTVGNSGGGSVKIPATTTAGTGFVVSNKMYNAVNVAGPAGENAAPYVTATNSVQIARFGSGLEIPLAIDPSIVASLMGGAINQQISFDPVAQRVVAYNATLGALSGRLLRIEANSKVITIDSTSGLPVWSVGPAALVHI